MTGGYHGRVNPDLLDAMPADVARVLEIGCGEGALAKAYLRRNPTCHYVGVECHAPSAAIARGRMTRVFAADAETLKDPGGPFDLIVLGDVLEHLADPEAMLDRLHGWLAPDGHLVACVPNIAHWSALREVVAGRWPTAQAGLFDRTHRRFFTHASLLALLRARGFRPIRCRPRDFGGPEADTVISALTPSAVALGEDAEAFRARALALQYVVVAGRAEAPVRPFLRVHQLALAPDMMAARVAEPARLLKARPHVHLTTAVRDWNVPKAPVGGGVLVIQRPRWSCSEMRSAAIAHLRTLGWVVVIEFDDDPALVARVLGDPSADIYHAAFAAADAVQTSTPALARLIAVSNPEVQVFPNAMTEIAPPRAPRTGALRVFYGALNRGEYAAQVARALTDLPDLTFTVAHDRQFFEALPTQQKTFVKTMDYQKYLEALSQSDVALMPLEGRAEEQSKSDLKWIEAAARGCAAIVSPAVYGASVQDGETGLIAPAPADFRAALAWLAADPSRCATLARAARAEVVRTRMLGPQVAAREAWYRSLVDRRATLHAAALARG